MSLNVPAWALETVALLAGVVFILNYINKNLVPALQPIISGLYQLASKVAALEAGHENNKNSLNNLSASQRADRYSLVALAKSLPAGPLVVPAAPSVGTRTTTEDINKTTVIEVAAPVAQDTGSLD